MEEYTLPLTAIESSLPLAVYSEGSKRLISEHSERGGALKALSAFIKNNPTSDAAIYQRGTVWTCILRCPVSHNRWLAEMERKFARKDTPRH